MFGFGQTPSAPAGGGFSFGANTGATTTASTGFNFGGVAQSTAPSTGFAGFGATANTAAAAPTAATTTAAAGGFGGFGFGGAAPPTKPATSGFNFGAATQPAANAASTLAAVGTTANTSTAGLGAGGFFGIKAPASTVAATTTTTVASAPGLGGFGGFGSTTNTSSGGSVLGGLLTAPATKATTLATTSAPSGFSLGTTPASSTGTTGLALGSTTTTQASTAPTLGGGLGLGGLTALSSGFGSTAAQSSANTSTATSTATATTAPSLGGGTQKQMTFRQLEDTINKWTTELEEQERYFLDQATQVNAWDRIVMENGEKIIQLNKDVERVKLDQSKLDHELDFVRSQQKELEELLEPLEKALDDLPPISHQQHAHLEREHTYMLAESLDSQLKRMGQDLKEIVERLNSNSSKPDSNDPVQQITKILNAHVVSLMWVDRNSADLQRRVEDIAKLMESEKREQERNFRLAYS